MHPQNSQISTNLLKIYFTSEFTPSPSFGRRVESTSIVRDDAVWTTDQRRCQGGGVLSLRVPRGGAQPCARGVKTGAPTNRRRPSSGGGVSGRRRASCVERVRMLPAPPRRLGPFPALFRGLEAKHPSYPNCRISLRRPRCPLSPLPRRFAVPKNDLTRTSSPSALAEFI